MSTLTVATLRAVVSADTAGFERGMEEAKRAAASLEEEARRAADAVAGFDQRLKAVADRAGSVGKALQLGVTLPVTAATAAAVKFASDAGEALNKLQVVLGDSASSVEAWSRSAAGSLGMSTGQALEATGTLGNLFTTMGFGQAEAARMSREMVQLSADLASFHNVAGGSTVALEKLRSGLVGEAEPMRQLGVLLNETAVQAKAVELGLAGAGGELTEAAKVQARYALILEQTQAAQGDFARTSGDVANSTRVLVAEIRTLGEGLGKDLLPLVKELLSQARGLVSGFSQLPAPVQRTVASLVLLAAAIGPVLVGFSKLVLAYRQVLALQGVAAAVGGLSAGGAAAGTAAGAGAAAGIGGLAGIRAATGALLAGGAGAGVMTGLGAGAAGAAIIAGGAAGFLIQDALDLWGERRRLRAADAANASSARQAEHLRRMAAARGLEVDSAGRLVPRATPAVPGVGTATAAAPGGDELQRVVDATHAARLAEAKALAGGNEGHRARAEAQALIPVLRERQQELAKRAGALLAQAEPGPAQVVQYQELRQESWAIQERIQSLETAAQREEAAARERAQEQQQRLVEEYRAAQEAAARQAEEAARERALLAQAEYRAVRSRVMAIAEQAAGDQRARALLVESLPVLQRQMAELQRQATAAGTGTREYYELQAEYWQAQRELASLQRRAEQEAQDEQHRALQEAERARDEQLRTIGQAVRLREAQLRNVIGLDDRTRGRAMLPVLLQQLQAVLQPVAGETPRGRLERLTEAEGVKGSLLEAVGARGRGAFAALPGGGAMPTFDVRAVLELDAIVRRIEAQAARATPVQVMVSPPAFQEESYARVFADPRFQEQLHALVARFSDLDARAALGR